ncbi:MAG: hypothetical protein FWF55_05465 [Treponema sp.]|nr:hypothetical protein [Treponema sp.]
MGGLIGIVVVIFIIGCVIGFFKAQKRSELKNAYDEALKGTDKQKALSAGREYYASLRKGKILTTYDEAAINNDIATMKG